MFTKLSLKNYRTHRDSHIEPQGVTLLIGSNNSGKTNFLHGLRDFAQLIRLEKGYGPGYSLFSVSGWRHRLDDNYDPVCFTCEWRQKRGSPIRIGYEIEIRSDGAYNTCVEHIKIRHKGQTINENAESKTDNNGNLHELQLQNRVREKHKGDPELSETIDAFFRDITSIYYYNLQPDSLRANQPEQDGATRSSYIAPRLGINGDGLQSILKEMRLDPSKVETMNRFMGFTRRFVSNFIGVILNEKWDDLGWQFDFGGHNFPHFFPKDISDGLLRAAAIALLCCEKNPPAIIALEEVENGINQHNIDEIMSWLCEASELGAKTQFLITSHNPSIIRAFSNEKVGLPLYLDSVYNVHIKKSGMITKLVNLNDAIRPLVDMGTIREDGRIRRKRDRKEIIKVNPDHIVDMFYRNVLGDL